MFTIFMLWAIACSVDRFGRKPLLLSWNLASQIGSKTCKIHCCTNLSQIAGIPRGRVFPFGLGISTRRTGLGLYHANLCRTFETASSLDNFSICFIVRWSTPAVRLPVLRLIFRYANRIFSSDKISGIKSVNTACALLLTYRPSNTSVSP